MSDLWIAITIFLAFFGFTGYFWQAVLGLLLCFGGPFALIVVATVFTREKSND